MNNTLFVYVDMNEFNVHSLTGTVKPFIRDTIVNDYDIVIELDSFMIRDATPIITKTIKLVPDMLKGTNEEGLQGTLHIRDTLMVKIQLT
jgi:hypothetical protein